MASKDHDRLDTIDATNKAIAWELGRYARRMKEAAHRTVDEQIRKAIEQGTVINALEISEAAVRAAKAQIVSDARIDTAPARRRITKK